MRTSSHVVRVRDVSIGGDAPPIVQAMIKADSRDVDSCVREVRCVHDAGAQIVRIAIPDRPAVDCLRRIRESCEVPLVADIHFDHRLALDAIDAGVDKIRVNPGNLTQKQLLVVAERAQQAGIPVRLGINSGSLPAGVVEDMRQCQGNSDGSSRLSSSAEILVEAAASYVGLLEQQNFHDIVVSVKCSDVLSTIVVNRLLAKRIPYPIHLGVTATGPAPGGIVRSAIGIGTLLQEGIGDTFRVSVTGSSIEEVRIAREILSSLGLIDNIPRLIACPTCGRTRGDVNALAAAVMEYLDAVQSPIVVAVMGCEVNGPGEAKEADIGIACTRGGGILFRKGKRMRRLSRSGLLPGLLAEIQALQKS